MKLLCSIHLREDYIKDLEIKLKLSEKSGDSTNAVALSVQQQQQTDIIEVSLYNSKILSIKLLKMLHF